MMTENTMRQEDGCRVQKAAVTGNTESEDTADRLVRRQKTLDFLEEHGIGYELYTHPPLPTVKAALEYWKDVDATHCKNLFFRNHKGNRHYLVVLECHKEMDIHALEHKLRQGKLSFASEERMERCLGLKPGSVSPLGLINDIGVAATANPKELYENGHRVKLFLDKDLTPAKKLSFHPCENTSGAVISNADFMRFLEIWGGEYEWLDINGEG